jgi:hypothetical protein
MQIGVKLILLLLNVRDNTEDSHDQVDHAQLPYDGYHIKLPSQISGLVTRLHSTINIGSQTRLDDAKEIIHKILFSLWTREWVPSKKVKLADPTMHLVMLTQLRADGSFHEVHNVTGILARLTALMVSLIYYLIKLVLINKKKRLLFLREAHKSAEVDEDISVNTELGRLQKWYIEGVDSTFRSVRALQHTATFLAEVQQSMPRIFWVEEGVSMEYKGNFVRFDNVRTMVHQIQDAMVNVFKELQFSPQNCVKYQKLFDNMRDRTPGFSFLEDQRNRGVLAKKDILLQYVLERDTDIVSISQSGEVQWSQTYMLQWLQKYARLNKLLLLAVEMNTGGPARGSELTGMTFQNSVRNIRNLMIFSEHVCFIRAYHKMQARSGIDKLIPEPLDAVTGDILIQNLCVLRPFAQILASQVWPDQANIFEMYRDKVFINFDHLLETSDLTHGLEEFSLQALNFKIGTNDWRHMCISWKRLRMATLLKKLEEHETVEAAQAGHSRIMDVMHYGVTTNLFEGAQEDIIPLYLKASASWQSDLHITPGGKFMPFDKCTHQKFKVPTITKGVSDESTDIAQQVIQAITPLIKNVVKEAISELRPSGPVVEPAVVEVRSEVPAVEEDDFDDIYEPYPTAQEVAEVIPEKEPESQASTFNAKDALKHSK